MPTGVAPARACFHKASVGAAIDCRAEMSPADNTVGRAAIQAPPHGVGALVPRRELFDAAYSSLESDFRGALERGAARLPVPANAVR